MWLSKCALARSPGSRNMTCVQTWCGIAMLCSERTMSQPEGKLRVSRGTFGLSRAQLWPFMVCLRVLDFTCVRALRFVGACRGDAMWDACRKAHHCSFWAVCRVYEHHGSFPFLPFCRFARPTSWLSFRDTIRGTRQVVQKATLEMELAGARLAGRYVHSARADGYKYSPAC